MELMMPAWPTEEELQCYTQLYGCTTVWYEMNIWSALWCITIIMRFMQTVYLHRILDSTMPIYTVIFHNLFFNNRDLCFLNCGIKLEMEGYSKRNLQSKQRRANSSLSLKVKILCNRF